MEYIILLSLEYNVDEHIDLINTLGDMVDQKEEAKMEKLIETMPMMIQTHLITCKDWAAVKDTAKSLAHTIMKCDPPTPAMPMMATYATVLGLYSHIAHSVDKEEGEIPQPFKGTKQKQTRGRGKPKGKPHEQRQNPPKAQEADEAYGYESPDNYYHMITTMPQVRVETADLLLVKAVTDNLEVLHNKTVAKDLNIVNISFRIIDIREVHPNKTVLNTGITANPIFREIREIVIEAEVAAMVLNILEDAVVVGPTIRVVMEHISITRMTHSQNNVAHPAVYVAILTIHLSIVTKENMM